MGKHCLKGVKMYSSYTTTKSYDSPINIIIILVEILAVAGAYLYLRNEIKNNRSFSGFGWGFFAGLFMGGLGDIIFYTLMNNLLSNHLAEGNKGKSKPKQEKNTATIKALKKSLGAGLAISFVVHIIIRVLIIVIIMNQK